MPDTIREIVAEEFEKIGFDACARRVRDERDTYFSSAPTIKAALGAAQRAYEFGRSGKFR